MFTEIAALPAGFHVFLAAVLGLMIGSFLNVVIYRYPKRLKHQWTVQSKQWLEIEEKVTEQPPGIISPSSHCGNCKSPVKAWQNIPVISFVILRGKCANCKTSIGLRYPLVEILTGILSAFVVYKFGWSLQSLFGLILTWTLVTLSFIDFDHQLLPDDFVLPILWLGLAISALPIFAIPIDSIIGAIAGYLALWIVFQLFKLLTGKEGMGYGDFKLLALLGAWFGWQMLPQIILISTVVGSVIGILLIATKKTNAENTIPFGPYISIAGWIAMIWGDAINQTYFSSMSF